jgi:hypothetical protein
MLGTLLAMFAVVPLQTTWTVDDNGPADFPTIQQAIDAAASGDLVLIQPGEYPGFLLTKDLRLVGKAGVAACMIEGVATVLGVSDFSLVGLQMERLVVGGLTGEGLVDDCAVGPFSYPDEFPPALVVNACSQLLVQRTSIRGGSLLKEIDHEAGIGANVIASGVAFVGCTIRGTSGSCSDGDSDGAMGLTIRQGSEVILAGTSVFGGNCASPGIPVCNGSPANAIQVLLSTLVVRGDASDKLQAGFDEDSPDLFASAIYSNGGNIVWSGVTVTIGDAAGTQPPQPEPFATVEGGKAPGEDATVNVSGPAGALAWLVLSGGAGSASLGGWDADLWLDPTQIFLGVPVVTTGQQTPVPLAGVLPATPTLAGVTVRGQVAFPGVPSALEPGSKLMGNPFAIALRF